MINESGVYALIFGSNLPHAKEFKHHVTSNILPSIRKYGYYSVENFNDNEECIPEEFKSVVKLAEENNIEYGVEVYPDKKVGMYTVGADGNKYPVCTVVFDD